MSFIFRLSSKIITATHVKKKPNGKFGWNDNEMLFRTEILSLISVYFTGLALRTVKIKEEHVFF